MSKTHVFLIILDSVRRDEVFYSIKNKFIPELKEDFIDFKKCNSIYTNTFLSHYSLFFGDYLNIATNPCFPAQLKDLDYNIHSYCNYAVLLGYPKNKNSESRLEEINRPTLADMIEFLGIKNDFDLEDENFGKRVEDYYGAADDLINKIPEKWKQDIQKINNKNTFMYLHFWSTHHNYGINELLDKKINGRNYAELGNNLVNRIIEKNLTLEFIKKVYYKRIYKVIQSYIYDFIRALKSKGIYDESLIIITADHGEGLGDIGYDFPKRLLPLYYFAKRIYNKIKREFISKIPDFRKIFFCKWDKHVFFHNGGYGFQKQIPLFIKFPNQIFGGIHYNKEVSLFDIIHTINDFSGSSLKMNFNLGCSLIYLLKKGESAREKYKLKKTIGKSIENF